MNSSSSDDSDSEAMSKSIKQLSSKRKNSRVGVSRGERSKRSLEDSEDSADTEHKELISTNWQPPTLGVTPSMYLDNDDSESASRMNFELDDDDSELDDDDFEDGSILDSPFGLGNSNFCWPPPGVENVIQSEEDRKLKGEKKRKPGIIYLSSIPNGYNVSRTTGFFSQYGRVGRVFLQPDMKERNKRKDKLARNFTEGWIEFHSKRVAKDVAANLNMTQVGGKKRAKSHDVIWNLKYLPGFKWTNLSERLAYEKAVHQQRMRTEISQAKRETDYFRANIERSKRLNVDRNEDSRDPSLPVAKKSRKSVNLLQSKDSSKRVYEFRQKETDETIKKRKQLEQAQGKLSNDRNLAQESYEAKGNAASMENKSKKSVKDSISKKELSTVPSTKVLKVDNKSNSKTKNKSKGAPSNKLEESKSSNPSHARMNKTSKAKTRKGSSSKKNVSKGSIDRTEFLRNVFL